MPAQRSRGGGDGGPGGPGGPRKRRRLTFKSKDIDNDPDPAHGGFPIAPSMISEGPGRLTPLEVDSAAGRKNSIDATSDDDGEN